MNMINLNYLPILPTDLENIIYQFKLSIIIGDINDDIWWIDHMLESFDYKIFDCIKCLNALKLHDLRIYRGKLISIY